MKKLFPQFALIFILLSLVLNIGSCGPGGSRSGGEPSGLSNRPSTGSGPSSSASDDKGPLTAWKLYQALDVKSNEAVLIQRAAMYIINNKKEADFNTASDADKKASVEKLMQGKNFQSIVDMLNKMSSVHRCNYRVLSGMDRIGFALSNEIMAVMNPRDANGQPVTTLTDKTVDVLMETFGKKWSTGDLRDIIRLSAIQHFINKYDGSSGKSVTVDVEGCRDGEIPSAQVLGKLDICKKAIQAKLTTNQPDVEKIQKSLFVFFSVGSPGIGFEKDKELGTNKFIFSILGIHRNEIYGGILLQIDQSLLSDPQTFTTLVAATHIENQSYGVLAGRPWITPKEYQNGGGKADYGRNKIRNSRPGVLSLVIAADFIARVKAYDTEHGGFHKELLSSLNKFRPSNPGNTISDVTADDIRKFMQAISIAKKVDLGQQPAIFSNHTMPEVHLPIFSIDKINKIFVNPGTRELVDKGHELNKYVPLENIPKDKFVVAEDAKLNEKAEEYTAPQ